MGAGGLHLEGLASERHPNRRGWTCNTAKAWMWLQQIGPSYWPWLRSGLSVHNHIMECLPHRYWPLVLGVERQKATCFISADLVWNKRKNPFLLGAFSRIVRKPQPSPLLPRRDRRRERGGAQASPANLIGMAPCFPLFVRGLTLRILVGVCYLPLLNFYCCLFQEPKVPAVALSKIPKLGSGMRSSQRARRSCELLLPTQNLRISLARCDEM